MIASDTYQITIPFESNTAEVINYYSNRKDLVSVKNKEFKAVYKIGQEVNLPFLHWKLDLANFDSSNFKEEVIIRFNSFDNTVSNCMNLNVIINEKSGSILKVDVQGKNKNRLVDFLNTTVEVLIKKQLDNKNKFAENTISFIDETLGSMEQQLKNSGDELKDFAKRNDVIEIEEGGASVKEQLLEFDTKKADVERKISYLNSLRK